MSCAIIIPAIKKNKLLENCIEKCLKQKKVKVHIYVILDILNTKKKNYKNVTFIKSSKNISAKRNLGVKIAKEKYIAFIDSDAYPEKNWVFESIKNLKKNKKIGLVTGCDVAYPNESGTAKVVALVNKSKFTSGTKSFRKNLKSKSRFVNHASSCNMVLEKKFYDRIGGMNEDIYVGEDIAFCNKLTKYKKIFFTNKSIIYHKTRSLIPFILQRFTYGTAVTSSYKNFSFNKNFEFFIPSLIILTLIFTALFYPDYLKMNLIIYFLISFFILIESIKIAGLKSSFMVYLLNIISILSFGIGTLLSLFLSIKKIKKIYTKR